MQLSIEIPQEAVEALGLLHMTPDDYVKEIVRDGVERLLLGADAEIASRPDWQTAIRTGRDEIAGGQGVPDSEVVDWERHHGT
jgi:hypothetical protein